MTLKTDEELKKLHRLGYDGITIGVETGDNEALTFMHKGYLDVYKRQGCVHSDSA